MEHGKLEEKKCKKENRMKSRNRMSPGFLLPGKRLLGSLQTQSSPVPWCWQTHPGGFAAWGAGPVYRPHRGPLGAGGGRKQLLPKLLSKEELTAKLFASSLISAGAGAFWKQYVGFLGLSRGSSVISSQRFQSEPAV